MVFPKKVKFSTFSISIPFTSSPYCTCSNGNNYSDNTVDDCIRARNRTNTGKQIFLVSQFGALSLISFCEEEMKSDVFSLKNGISQNSIKIYCSGGDCDTISGRPTTDAKYMIKMAQ